MNEAAQRNGSSNHHTTMASRGLIRPASASRQHTLFRGYRVRMHSALCWQQGLTRSDRDRDYGSLMQQLSRLVLVLIGIVLLERAYVRLGGDAT